MGRIRLALYQVLCLSFLLLSPHSALAVWEVAVIFLGADQPATFQEDIDRNLMELFRLNPNENFKLGILRDFTDHTSSYVVEMGSSTLSKWNPLFHNVPVEGFELPGVIDTRLKTHPNSSALTHPIQTKDFLSNIFQDPNAKRVLILYGHGHAFDGFEKLNLIEFRSFLESSIPKREGHPLDLLWMDSCFMGSIEVVTELRKISPYFLGVEDAEFSAGAPFEQLDDLKEDPKDVEAVAIGFAERVVESYSFVKKGAQRNAVYSSAAVISLIDTRLLNPVLSELSSFINVVKKFPGRSFTQKQLSLLRRKDQKREMVGRSDIVDLGAFMKYVKNHKKAFGAELSKIANSILKKLGISNSEKLSKIAPRVHVQPPKEDSLMVFGFQAWTKGYEGDTDTINKLPKALTPTHYVVGPHGKKWPARLVHKKLVVSPYSPGLNFFGFFFSDPVNSERLSKTKNFERISEFSDFYTKQAIDTKNPIRFLGYTQGVGNFTERYTGLGILDPSKGETGLDYVDSAFNEITNWGSL
jgi:hypothetical protein